MGTRVLLPTRGASPTLPVLGKDLGGGVRPRRRAVGSLVPRADPEFSPWLLGQGDRREDRRGHRKTGTGRRGAVRSREG